jgi:hypothetical protein
MEIALTSLPQDLPLPPLGSQVVLLLQFLAVLLWHLLMLQGLLHFIWNQIQVLAHKLSMILLQKPPQKVW